MDISSFAEVLNELSNGFQPTSDYWVTVTHIANPQHFHVRPTKFDHHLQRLESYLQDSNECIEQPSINQLVVYQSNVEGLKIVRGQIKVIEDSELSQTCNILALDYGFLDERIPVNQIYKCDYEIFSIPPLAVLCCLFMCLPVGSPTNWTDDSTEAFRYFLDGERAKIIVQHKLQEKLIVMLINTCPDDMSTMLANTGYATLGYIDPHAGMEGASAPVRRPDRYFYDFPERHVGDTLHVRMLSGNKLSEFSVAEVQEYYEHLDLKDDINLYAARERELKVEELTIGRPVLMWEEQKLRSSQRAYIEDVSPCGSEVTLVFIDTGKKLVVPKQNIKAVVQELLIPPALAIFCRAEKLPAEIKRKNFFVPGFEFKITINKLGNQLKSPNKVTISPI